MVAIIRDIFGAIDSAIYSVVAAIYGILMRIADVEIFSSDVLRTFSERVYAILGIFMAFKLLFSFINYAVNPDAMSETKTGGKKLVMNILISLVLLIAVPGVIFPLARRLQNAILDDGILQELILGIDQTSYNQSRNLQRASRSMSYSVLSSFFYPRTDICSGEQAKFYQNAEGTCDGGECFTDPEQANNMYWQLDGNCAQNIIDNLDDSHDGRTVITTYERSYNQFSYKTLLGGKDDYNLKNVKDTNGDYIFEYNILITTIAGIAVGWALVMFCFQIAVRTIKLGFLELVAPIPILSYIDTKAKATSFDGWVKACISTYLDLFIRLAAIYFAVFVVSSISIGDLHYATLSFRTQEGTASNEVGLMVKFFIIMGALMFAQQLPKLISDITGVKLDGSFSLNPLKSSPLASKVLGGAVGLAGGAALGAVSNAAKINQTLKQNRELKKSLMDPIDGTMSAENKARYLQEKKAINPLSIVGGAFGGGARSMVSGYKQNSAIKGISAGVTASSQAREARRTGYGMKQKAMNEFTRMANIQDIKTGETDAYDSETKALKEQLANTQRDESGLSQARSDLFRENISGFSSALKENSSDLKYSNYDSYVADNLDRVMEQQYKDRIEQVRNSQWSEDQKRVLIDRYRKEALKKAVEDEKLISEKQFSDYEVISKRLEHADTEGKRLEKEIKARELNRPDKK